MTAPSRPASAASTLRTGFKVGAAFVGSVAMCALLGIFFGGGLFLWHVLRLQGAGSHAGHAGGFGAVVAVLSSPPLMVAVLLLLFMPLYVLVGMAHGRSRALAEIVRVHGDAVAARMAAMLADRIESTPRLAAVLEAAPERLSVDALSRQLAPVLGEGRLVRAALRSLVRRLPMHDLIAGARPLDDEPAAAEASSLRGRLQARIVGALERVSAPSWRPLHILLAANALVFAVGWWMTRPA